MNNYLITGGNGFIGKNLARFLENRGKEFKIVDVKADPCFSHTSVCLNVALHIPSIESNTLVHLASETNVRKSVKEPIITIRNNVKGVVNCLELLRGQVFKEMVFTSSANSHLCTNPYLASKQCCENICEAYRQSYGVKVRILKLSNVYGPYSIHKHSVIPTFIRACIDKQPLVIFGTGAQRRDFVYVSDVIRAIYEGGEGLVASGDTTSIITLVHLISELSEELTGFSPPIVHEEAVKGEVFSAVEGTDIDPRVDLEDGLKMTFEWFLENYGTK